MDAADAQGRIYTKCCPAGGRKVASSNLAAPTWRKPASKAGFRHFGVPGASRREAPWYQHWYQASSASTWVGFHAAREGLLKPEGSLCVPVRDLTLDLRPMP